MNLIDRDEFITELNNTQIEFDKYYKGLGKAKSLLIEQPIVDAKLIKYGQWIEEPLACNGDYIIRCSVCNRAMIISKQIGMIGNYCPNCGAKMNKEQ